MSSDAPAPAHSETTDWAIQVRDLGKVYRLYDKPHHRLMQSLWGERKRYFREFASLDKVSFSLNRGQTLGIIGRNGAGKSTLLQVICGTLAPTSGAVEVRGRIAALLELGTGFNPDFSGRENIHINAAILGLTPEQIAQRIDDIIAFADIGLFIDQPVKTYSSGMYVRLAFAVVIHVDPDILVVDEALAVGDAMFQAKCMTRMRRMLDDGLTLLFISHDISAVKALCAHTLWLEHGQVRAYGPTSEVTRAYDQDWIHQANAAQGLPASPVVVAEHNLIEEQLDASNTAPAVGTHGVYMLAVGWGAQGVLGTQARAGYGEHLCLRLRLQVRQPCSQLVVSYHIKNRQNQHVLGGHTADRPDVYAQQHQVGDVIDITFDIPVHIHQGDYALTVLAASIGDVERYTDVVFHLWADDVATLQVTPRQRFPLSDHVEPPPAFSVLRQKPWVVLDDFFPNLLTGFRVAEYNAHLCAFAQLTVLSNLGDFAEQHRHYAQRYPEYATRVQPFSPAWLVGCGLAYLNFLNNAIHYLPMLEEHRIPFVLTLYPGGGFGLDEPESDDKLARVLGSAQLQALIVTQPVTEHYVQTFTQRRQLSLPVVHRIDGVVVNPLYFETLAPMRQPAAGDSGLNICFVAECYMPLGANKGYPEFIAAAIALADQPHLHWHVVGGGFSAEDLDTSALAGRLHYHGRLETTALRAFFGGMHLIVSPNRPRLLHPGNFDGFPTGCCVEAALCGVAIMATDALQQNPGYVDGESIYLLSDPNQTLARQIENRIRPLLAQPSAIASVAQAGQALTRRLYDPQRQIGERQRILSEIGQRLASAKP